MSVPVRMPKLGMAAHEGVFVEWLVEDGRRVDEEQPIYIVATDKVETEIPAPATGVLRHGDAVPDGTYPVGTLLATIETDE
ncbi:biotin-requiring enzyme family protein [Actinomadura sp. KC345]|uniref:biotin/lipoyl-containing protein n=1 Tax=Actinomadura sp. KC345 TaxID=2530371 RepID=UPI0010509E1D|nr:biotin/lipoyl-containing protein [Actinomadura sp. KC345]TDC57432.1 biotin-requiring enzyme family protein [Actinomadura sp. KC345]